MALTFAAYTVPEPWRRPAALAAVVAVAAVNYRGITRTAQLTRVLVTAVLLALATGLAVSLGAGTPDVSRLALGSQDVHAYGVLQSAALLFFAFAGYARIATLAEEVRDPARTIPRAVTTALLVTVGIYAAVGATVLAVLGPDRVANAAAPLAEAVESTGQGWASAVIRVGAAVASLGALLALVAGVGRTALAMGRHRDLPRWLAAIHPRFHVPHHAEVAVAAAVCLLVLTVDLRGAIGFSAFGVLLYYLVANLAAFTQDRTHRRYPRFLQVLGAVGCVVLALTVPAGSLLAGVLVLAAGITYRLWRARHAGN
jgi:APA family basic amino acid/polyamine antiporter